MEDQPKQKQWWAPVWKGLVMDMEAKHYRKMKNAVWLYLYLLLNANRRTALLMRHYGGFSYEEIASHLGCPVGTAKRRVFFRDARKSGLERRLM